MFGYASSHRLRLLALAHLLSATVADYINQHTGCEPYCTALTCTQLPSQCGLCTFCKGPQLMSPQMHQREAHRENPKTAAAVVVVGGAAEVEHQWKAAAANTSPAAKLRLDGGAANITHFWDCCKPSCAWDSGQGKARVPLHVMCDEHGRKIGFSGLDAASACDEPKAFLTPSPLPCIPPPLYHLASSNSPPLTLIL